MKIKVAVHNGIFHADDVLCVTMLMYKFGKENIEVIRTRDESIYSECDFVLDVGAKDLISDKQVCFDHHQKDSEYYENGIKKAACGKLAEFLFGKDKDLLEAMRNNFLYAIEAPDNGQKLEDFNLKSSSFEFIPMLNANWTEDLNVVNDENFMKACDISLQIFERQMENIRAKVLAKNVFDKALENYDKDSRILFLDKYIPWQGFVVDANKNGANIAAVYFIGSDGNYDIWSIPEGKDDFSPARLPQEWAGLRNEELQKVSGINSAVFCFMPRCFFVCSDKEDALKVAEIIVKEQKNIESQNINKDIR